MSLFSATNQERPYNQLLHNWFRVASEASRERTGKALAWFLATEILEATLWHSGKQIFKQFTSTIGTGLQHRFEAYVDKNACYLKNSGQSLAIASQRGWHKLYRRRPSWGKHGGKCCPQNNFLIFSAHLGCKSSMSCTRLGNPVSALFFV